MRLLTLLTGLAVAGCQGATQPDGTGSDTPPAAPAWLTDVTDKLGITFAHDAGPSGDYFMPQSMVAGCAVIDADGDGRLDLVFLQSAGENSGRTNELYLQQPDGTFKNATAGSGLDFDGISVGVAVGDLDNDGRDDLVITRYTGVKVLRNLGGGKFEDVTQSSGIDNPLWGASLSFLDYDRDGRLDLFVANYIDYDKSWPCKSPDGKRDYCGPKTFPGTADRLYRNVTAPGGPVKYEDVTLSSGVAAKTGPGLGVYCVDLTGDGWADIFVANDGAPNHCWVNQKDGTFKDEAVSRGVAYTAMGNAYANMGIAAGDYDNNGLVDLFVTHLGSETHTLWRQGPPGLFRDQTRESRVTSTAWRGTGFGAVAADFDLDGWADIAFVNGRVYSGPVPPGADHLPEFWRVYAERNQLLQNRQGQFADISDANPDFCGRPNVGRGLALADLNGDGRPDLVTLPTQDRARVYYNTTAANNGVTLKVLENGRPAVGARVRVTAGGREFTHHVQPGHSYLSSSTPDIHVGLGAATGYDSVEVAWPTGETRQYPGGKAGEVRTITP